MQIHNDYTAQGPSDLTFWSSFPKNDFRYLNFTLIISTSHNMTSTSHCLNFRLSQHHMTSTSHYLNLTSFHLHIASVLILLQLHITSTSRVLTFMARGKGRKLAWQGDGHETQKVALSVSAMG